MKVLVFADAFFPDFEHGGPVTSLLRMTEAAPWVQFRIITRSNDLTPKQRVERDKLTAECVPPNVHVERIRGPLGLIRLSGYLREEATTSDLVYITSLHSPFSSILPLALIRLRILPTKLVVLSPRGEVAPNALDQKKIKKRLARPFLRKLASGRMWWHAMHELESRQIAKWRGKNASQTQVVIAPNLPPPPVQFGLSIGANPQGIAFTSRVSPIKGLREAIELVGRVNSDHTLNVYGFVSDLHYAQECELFANQTLGMGRVSFNGPYTPSQLGEIYGNSRVMLLPTKSESYGHALLEALAHGCVVFVPDTTPWTDLVLSCGGHILRSQEADARYLRQLLEESREEHALRRAKCHNAYTEWFLANKETGQLFDKLQTLDEA